jgi:hypothetical protein
MSYRLVVRPKAAQEAIEAYIWFEMRTPGRGERFFDAVDECYGYITHNPLGFQLRKQHYRHAMVAGFDFRIVFAIVGETVQVFQIRHTSRRPSKRFGP